MSEPDYIFHETESDSELARLRAIEAEFDDATRDMLIEAGIAEGWRCLEVGAGAGSIATWMADRVGSTGYVAAIDLNPRFLAGVPRDNLGVIEGDIRRAVLEPEAFDLAHARYVLIHIADWETALHAMNHTLKRGGALVLEEPDFSVARVSTGSERERAAFDNIKRAIAATFAVHDMNHALGGQLEQALEEHGLDDISVRRFAPSVRGGTRLAGLLAASARQLRDKYLATGEASEDDIDVYLEATASPDFEATFYDTVSARARKP